jgi:hypothetical protein
LNSQIDQNSLRLCLPGLNFQNYSFNTYLGTWKYKVNTDDGEVFAFSKVEFKEKNVLYMELDTGYELMEPLETTGEAFQ